MLQGDFLAQGSHGAAAPVGQGSEIFWHGSQGLIFSQPHLGFSHPHLLLLLPNHVIGFKFDHVKASAVVVPIMAAMPKTAITDNVFFISYSFN